METHVLKSLAKLKKLVPRSQKELKDAVDLAQTAMTAALERKSKESVTAPSSSGAAASSASAVGGISGAVEVPFEPFLLAVLTRQAKLVALALDCIEKFLAFGFLKGNGSIPESIRRRLVQRDAKKPATGSAASGNAGSGGGSSTTASFGGSARDGGVSSNAIGSSAATGGDPGDDTTGGSALNEDNWKLIDCIVDVICDCNDHPDETVQIQVLRVLLTAVTTPTCEVHEHSLLKAVRACYHIQLVSKSTTTQTVAKATLQQIISIVFQRMETFDQRVQEETEATLREMQKTRGLQDPTATSEHGDESRSTSSFGHLNAGEGDDGLVADPTSCWYPDVTRALQLSVLGINIRAKSSALMKSQTSVAPVFAASFPSVLHKDAFLLFRSLCRISMRSVAEDAPSGAYGSMTSNANPGVNPPEDPFAFQSKILSLELVLSIINNAGPSFRRGERFVHAIRQYLCQSLLQNCTSNYTQIVGLSLQLFLVLINNFKRYLKAEIEIFVTSIFLRILQSDNSSFEHKMLVLEVLNNICDDAQILGEIFLNYDCDWNTNDLFEQIIDALAKIAKGKKDAAQQYASVSSSMRLKMQQNDAALVLKGLECLTATVASLKKAANFVEAERKSKEAARAAAAAKEAELDEDVNAVPAAAVAPIPTPPVSSSSSSTTLSAVEAFDRKKRRQEELATGILKFNVKPSAGVQYLIQHGHLGEGTPRDVARFLHEYNSKLDMTQIGDYLGKEQQYQNGFCVKVLHEFVDMMDFSGMEIDEAIRHFLSVFRLPGESQKIDRMMEKFAERFYLSCPPGLFPSADTAFILSFSIIMLQTDLHNPSIPEEKKMDKPCFVRNNRGINNGEDLPEEYLGGIYDRIKLHPISLKEDEEAKARVAGARGGKQTAGASFFGTSSAVADRQRRDAYIKERETMVRQSEALFKRRHPANSVASASSASRYAASRTASSGAASGSNASQFQLVTEFAEAGFVRPMFETVWAPLLAVCSVIFESSDAPVAIQLCLNSFKHAIHLAARLGMPSERDAFVTVLAKFTALHTTGSRTLRAKNVEAIKALISISVKEGNYLGDAWRDILVCISQLARLQTHAQGLHADVAFFQPTPGVDPFVTPANTTALIGASMAPASVSMDTPLSSSSSMSSRRGTSTMSASLSMSPSHRETASLSTSGLGMASGDDVYNPVIEDDNAARVLAEIDGLASDRVFSSSVALNDQAVEDFLVQLCVVSLSECSGASPTRGGVRASRASTHSGVPETTLPRVFSLQKLVEVADMNMTVRSRVIWARMWKVLSRHFTTIGCQDNLGIALYAIDSLRQLSMKFLEKEELKDFNFQRLFLAPFEVIMANAVSLDIKELVLRCVENMILARVDHIKSGWKTIWGVLRIAAETYNGPQSDSEEANDKGLSTAKIVQLGFQIAQRVFSDHFERIVDVFVDAVECLLAFGLADSENVDKGIDEHVGLTQIGVDSVQLMATVCLDRLARGEVIERVAVEATVSKRVGFKKKTQQEQQPVDEHVDVDLPSRLMRYQKQESTRTLEEDVAALSPPATPHALAAQPVEAEAAPLALYTDCAAHTRMWWPVLTALATLGCDRRTDVRVTALQLLFDGLDTHGLKLSTAIWALIFKGVLIPLLNDVRHLEVEVEHRVLRACRLEPSRALLRDHESTSTMCLERLLHTFGLFYDRIGFLPEVMFLLGRCLDTEYEEDLAVAAASALENMLVEHGHKFSEDVWGLIADELRSVLSRAEPTWVFFAQQESVAGVAEAGPLSPSQLVSPPMSPTGALLSPRGPSFISMYPSVVTALHFTFARVFPPKVISDADIPDRRIPSRTHLVVLLAVQKVLGQVLCERVPRGLRLSDGHVASVMQSLRESFVFARKVNDNVGVRRFLAQQGWQYGRLHQEPMEPTRPSRRKSFNPAVDEADLPNLLFQEVQGKLSYLNVLFHIITTSGHDEVMRGKARQQMKQVVQQTLDEYLRWTDNAKAGDAAQRVQRYTPLVTGLLEKVASFSAVEIQRHLEWLYPRLTELVKTRNEDVRIALSVVFRQCVSQLLPLPRS